MEKKTKLLGIIRHLLTFGGGIAVTLGHLDEAVLQEIIGLIVTLIGVVWSVFDKKKEN